MAYPITEILNASYAEQRLSTLWKMADVTPLPKKKPVVDIQKELRPISLTFCISKVAEELVVDGFVKPAVINILDDNQYGAIPNSSSTVALISMLHSWSLGTDGNGATVTSSILPQNWTGDVTSERLGTNLVLCSSSILRFLCVSHTF